jgi:hypothetical protein
MTEEDDFVKEGFAEVDQMEIDKLKNNADIAKIIASDKGATDFILVDGVKVNFTPFVSRKVRHKLASLKPQGQVSDIEEAENIIYQTIALLCTDDPYNKALTWKFIEASGGDASKHLAEIMGKISARADQMRKFQ